MRFKGSRVQKRKAECAFGEVGDREREYGKREKSKRQKLKKGKKR